MRQTKKAFCNELRLAPPELSVTTAAACMAVQSKIGRIKRTFAAMAVIALTLQPLSFSVSGQARNRDAADAVALDPPAKSAQLGPKRKISRDLEDKSDELSFGFRSDQTERVIIQLKSETGLNELFGLNETERRILFEKEVSKNQSNSGIILSDLVEAGGRMKKSFNNLGLVSAELPLSRIRQLSERDEVAYISPDRETSATGHINLTTGTDQIRTLVSGVNIDGTGVGIAVIDSGVDSAHHLHSTNDSYHSGIVYSKDFTGANQSKDPYGHGTFVAAVATGWNKSQSRFKNGYYYGVAPKANVVSLRALDNSGRGYASSVIAALDWAIANKAAYNIRVINMSLGTAATDSYTVDPLCLAARRAFNAGIVVVASAGNNGKDDRGIKQYGSIGSPGIEPTVITVGAINTYGTDDRVDDTVATYSSRGPTRGYRTLSNGARKYDNLIKPDIVAPGNKIITADAPNRDAVTSLVAQYPALAISNGWGSSDKVMYMSGTSVATPVVAGAVALMLQANPKLTPNLVKAILMYSAQPLSGFNTLEQGAGSLNVDGAVRLARLVKTTLPTANGGALLTGALPASQTSMIAGRTFSWGKGVITNFGFLSGNDLMNKWQAMYGNGVIMGDGTPFSSSSITRSTSLTSGTFTLYEGAIRNNGVIMGDGTLFLSSNAMGSSPTPILNSQGVLVSDGVIMGDGVVMGDGVMMGDGVIMGDTDALLGDDTACMLPTP